MTRAQRLGLADRVGHPDPTAEAEGRHPRHRWVLRYIVAGRRVPGWDTPDPLTLPFLARPSVHRRLADRARAADEARWNVESLGDDALDTVADRWVSLALRILPETCRDSLWCRCQACDRAFRGRPRR